MRYSWLTEFGVLLLNQLVANTGMHGNFCTATDTRANFPPEPVTIGEFTGFFAQKAPTVGISPDVNVPPLYPIFVVVFVLINIPY